MTSIANGTLSVAGHRLKGQFRRTPAIRGVSLADADVTCHVRLGVSGAKALQAALSCVDAMPVTFTSESGSAFSGEAFISWMMSSTGSQQTVAITLRAVPCGAWRLVAA